MLKVMKNTVVSQNNYGLETEIQQDGEEPLSFSGKRWFCFD